MSNRKRFSLKKFEKDKQKYKNPSDKDDKTSRRIKSIVKSHGTFVVGRFGFEALDCKNKDALNLCNIPIKDREMKKCKFCPSNT